ncbi:hypothetical protein ACOBV8_21610 (plasmid) [Pseudoalteromonas espejiana]
MLALYINNPSYPGKGRYSCFRWQHCRCTGYSPILLAVERSLQL